MEQIKKYLKDIIGSGKPEVVQAVDILNVLKYVFQEYEDSGLKSLQSTFADILVDDIENYKNKTTELDNEISKIQYLSAEKETIEKKFKKATDTKNYLDDLKIKKDFFTNNDVSKMDNEILENNLSVLNLKTEYQNKLQNLSTFLKNENDSNSKSLETVLNIVQENLNLLNDNILENYKTLDSSGIELQSNKNKEEYISLIEDYNKRVKKLNQINEDLSKIKEDHTDIMEVFKAHTSENAAIFGELENREGVLKYVENIQKEIANKLETYDNEIKTIIENRDSQALFNQNEFVEKQLKNHN